MNLFAPIIQSPMKTPSAENIAFRMLTGIEKAESHVRRRFGSIFLCINACLTTSQIFGGVASSAGLDAVDLREMAQAIT